MFRRTSKVIIFIVLLLSCMIMLLTGCNSDDPEEGKRVEWSETHTANRMSASYELFDGVETGYLNVETEQMIILRYDAKVESGELKIKIESAWGENVWQQFIKRDDGNEVSIQVKSNGKHKVMVIGKEAKGSFDVSWEKRDAENK